MKLLLDIGNTRLKWAVLDGARLGPTQALPLDGLPDAWPQHAAFPQGVTDALLASVAPAAVTRAVEARIAASGLPVRRMPAPRSTPRLRLAYAEPQRLGVDRWLALLAATGGATLAVSCGSALTLDLVDAAGQHHGGLIAPSPERMREALLAHVPHLRGDGRVVDFAASTADAVASGAVLSAVALIERQWRQASALLGTAPRLWLAGGGRGALLPHLALPFEEREQLVFEGMAAWLAMTAAGAAPTG
jgi:type III pantothenate kinase